MFGSVRGIGSGDRSAFGLLFVAIARSTPTSEHEDTQTDSDHIAITPQTGPIPTHPNPQMVYLFTRLPSVTPDDAFVGASGAFELANKSSPEAGSLKFAISIVCAPNKPIAPDQRPTISMYVSNTGETSKLENGSVVFASGVLIFGVTSQAMAFHADASDVRVLGKLEPKGDVGTIYCSYIGTVQSYKEQPLRAKVVNGLLKVTPPLAPDINFTTL